MRNLDLSTAATGDDARRTNRDNVAAADRSDSFGVRFLILVKVRPTNEYRIDDSMMKDVDLSCHFCCASF